MALAYHTPLGRREKVLGNDVAIAIDRIVGDGPTLPVAIHKYRVMQELVSMACEDDGGAPIAVPKAARKAMADQFMHRLSTSTIFASGYERYREHAKFPIVPVTNFFFGQVCGEMEPGPDLMECLDAMTDLEVLHSLPKRPSPALVKAARHDDQEEEEEKDTLVVVRDEENRPILFGRVDGVVVFPAGSQSPMLRAWLERAGNRATGQLDSAVSNFENARPNAPAIEKLKDAANNTNRLIPRALPKPKQK